MTRILSTKKLLPNQKQFLLNAGFSVIEADFIKIRNKQPELKNIKDNLIFTSRNAVKSILETANPEDLKTKDCFCVGRETKVFLEQNGFRVMAFSDYASGLATVITGSHNAESFTFFSGNLRQDILPDALTAAGIDWNEIEVYETIPAPQKINAVIDGILFFSPSGVASFLKENEIGNQTCFCIGETTAKALGGHTNTTVIAHQPSVENTIIQCINYYK